MKPGSDVAFLLSILEDGEPHSANEIRRRSFEERGCGLTVNSRASDLRKHGYVVECWHDPTAGRRDQAWLYRLAGVLPEGASEGHAPSGSPSLTPDSVSQLSPMPSDAGALTSDQGACRLSEFDRVIGESYVTAILAPCFVDESEIESFWLADDGQELVDEELAEELGEQQRALFLSEAA